MKVVGIVAEYNPFHNGHAYHIQKAKELTGADYVVVVMSGDFLQRGVPALLDKYSRTRMALANGIDLVLELPVCYAVGSAEFFAAASVLMLSKLGVVDTICFGSECGDVNILWQVANVLHCEPPIYRSLLLESLKLGLSYPAARSDAFTKYCALSDSLENHLQGEEDYLKNILNDPNNILGIEYIKAILAHKSSLKPVTILRKDAGYHDTILHGHISSATAIRRNITTNQSVDDIVDDVPNMTKQILKQEFNKSYPIEWNDFSSLLQYKLLTNTCPLNSYADVSSDLADRILNQTLLIQPLTDFSQELKTKQYTLTRIQRSLLHILLDMKQSTLDDFINKGYIYYGRMLGFGKNAAPLLKSIKQHAQIPIINKVAHGKKQLSPLAYSMFLQDLQASHIYQMIVHQKYAAPFQNEYQQNVIIY